MRRGFVVLALVALVAAGAFAATAWVAGGDDRAPTPTVTAPPPLARLTIIFPEGFTIREMADRVAAVRGIAIRKRGVTPRLTRDGYLRAVDRAVAPPRFRKDMTRDSIEGFLFPASYEFTQRTTARELVADQLTAFRQRFRTVDLSYSRSKNLTPYDVLIIASMIEKETAVPRERRLVAAVIYNRLRNRMPLGIDATIRYGLDIPGTESLTKAALRSKSPFNTRLRPWPAADADREPRPRLDPGRREPRARRLPLLRPQAEVALALLHGGRDRLPPQGLPVRLRLRLMSTVAPACGFALGADVLPRPLDQRAEHVAEVVGRLAIGVEPLGREELASRPLVLVTGLEAGEQPPVDVVDAHDVRIGRSGRICDPDRPYRDTPCVPGYVRAAQAPPRGSREPSHDRDPRHDDARRPARLADLALAVAADAERRVRGARARLGLRAAADAAGAARRRRARARGGWASPART